MDGVEGRRARRFLASGLVALGLICSGCLTGGDPAADGQGARPGSTRSHDPTAAGPFGLPDLGPVEATGRRASGLAFTAASTMLPELAPDGSPYEVCTVDYRSVIWTDEAEAVIERHTAASLPPCVGSARYQDTAFQNGILGFMVLVGRETLAEAGPESEAPEAMVSSLRRQGFDRLATIEVASTGRCDQGGVQAALFTLAESATLDGLEAMIDSAEAGGATVDRRPRSTIISGGDAPCAAAIVHNGTTLGWLTAADVDTLRLVLLSLDMDLLDGQPQLLGWPAPGDQFLGLSTA